MKEANKIDKGLVFQETFLDEQAVRKNNGTPTAVFFFNGVGTLNGSTSIIDYGMSLGKIKQGSTSGSIRFRVKPTDGQAAFNQYVVARYKTAGNQREWGVHISTAGKLVLLSSSDGISGVALETLNSVFLDGQANRFYDCVITFSGTTGAIYIDGVSVPLGTNSVSPVMFSGTSNLVVGNTAAGGTNPYSGDIDLLELYNYSLTAEDVSLLYKNSYSKLPKPALPILMEFNSTTGTIKDLSGLRTLTPSNVSIRRFGSLWGAFFNGVNSYIAAGADFLGTKNITISAWIYPTGYGGGNLGRILDNSATVFNLNSASGCISGSRNSFSFPSSATNSIVKNIPKMVTITSNTSGVSTFYINGEVSGTVGQSAGTPASGSTVYIGNRLAVDRAFNGFIFNVEVLEGIASLEYIRNLYTSQKSNYNL